MKPTELMVDDWVYISPWDCEPYVNKICGISYYSWQGKDYCDWVDCEDWDELSLDRITPIPLTDEILKKNGFEYYHKNFASLNQDDLFKLEMIEWPDENGIGGIWKIGIIEIRYVHELQHALKLCNINKNIVL